MKLELKHLAAYLPYALKGNLINRDYYEDVINGELFRIETGKTTLSNTLENFVIVNDNEDHIQFFTPLLRPLSDLIEAPEHILALGYRTLSRGGKPAWTFEQLEYLLSNHFDIYGLIDAGLAINKNTI